MLKRIISSLLAFSLVFTMLTNVIFAEENKNYTDNLVSADSIGNNLFEIQAIDSSGKAFANGHVTVYSYLENKTVGDAFLDDNGKLSFMYQPSTSLIEKELAKDGVVDVHYAVFVTNGEEVYTDGFTQTYYSPDFFVEKNSFRATKNSYLTDRVPLLKVQTKKIENDKNFEIMVNDSVETIPLRDGGGKLTILESRDLGLKPTDFIVANSAKGCKVTASIQKGTKTKLSGSNVLQAEFTASDALKVTQPTTVATGGVKYSFYTYYRYVEEKVQWTDGVSTIIYHRVRATSWEGGINYITYAESKNAVSPDNLASGTYSTFGPGSDVSVDGGVTILIGSAVSFTGAISGTVYNIDMNHVTYTTKAITRLHGDTTYYEYGTGKSILNKYITRY